MEVKGWRGRDRRRGREQEMKIEKDDKGETGMGKQRCIGRKIWMNRASREG